MTTEEIILAGILTLLALNDKPIVLILILFTASMLGAVILKGLGVLS